MTLIEIAGKLSADPQTMARALAVAFANAKDGRISGALRVDCATLDIIPGQVQLQTAADGSLIRSKVLYTSGFPSCELRVHADVTFENNGDAA